MRKPRRRKPTPTKRQALSAIQKIGVTRPADLESRGIPRAELYRLVEKGLVVREARGIYTATSHDVSVHHTLVQVAKRVPAGVFCLLTALEFHELTTQMPAKIWIALPEKARLPKLDFIRLRVARFSGRALTEGIEVHRIEGVDIKVYSAAKTVADCFKYRNKIGVSIAVEALQDFTERFRNGANDLARFSRICRVDRVMQPYLDSLP